MENILTLEKEEYIAKLDNQIQVIDRILKMNSGTVVSSELRRQLQNFRKEAEIVLKKLKDNEFEIAIVGEESSGKSTFANALMGNDILPRADKRCTYTSTRISYSDNDSADVSFYSRDEFNRDFTDKLRQLEFPNYERYFFDALDVRDYRKIYSESVPDSIKNQKNTDSIHSDIQTILEHQDEISSLLGRSDLRFESDRIKDGELTKYITDEVKALAVKGVVIYSQKLEGMKNAVIYDVPGFNSPTALHKQQTLSRMKSADAIIITAKGDEPSITEGPLKILRDSDDDGNPLKEKLFVFANKTERSTDIPANIQLIKKQWTNDYNFIDESKQDKRIFFGSALAHLQSLGLCLDKDGSTRALREFNEKKSDMPNGDGIEALRTALENYNRTERFEVLKRRVNKIKSDIFKAFEDIRSGHDNLALNRSYSQEQVDLINDFIDDTRPLLEDRLTDLRDNIRKNTPGEKPLSKQITEYITNNVIPEKFGISDEEIDKALKRSPYTGLHEDTARIEGDIRKEKFKIMYEDFSHNVINLADKHHSDYSKQIVDIMLDAMGITKSSPYYDDLKATLENELSVFRNDLSESDHSNKFYYQSLIERFSRDIYQVLILSQYNAERLREFYDNIDNFYSLSIFYKNSDCENDLSYIDIAPKDQPLCMMLLFHHYLNASDKIHELADEVCRITGIKELPEDLLKYAEKAFNAAGALKDSIINQITNAFSTVAEQSNEFRISLLRNTFSKLIDRNKPCSVADQEEFTRYYERYHSSLRNGRMYSTDDLKADFNVDILILQEVLKNALVRAINIEKPFVAKETKSIDDIIEYTKNSRSFRKLLSDNFYKIKYEDNQRLEKERHEQEQNYAIVSEINSVLDTLSNTTAGGSTE